MKFSLKQYQLINFKFFLIKIIYVFFLFLFNLGCGSKLNQKNYNQCVEKIEEDRQKVRDGNLFSYKSQSYEECRAPARYRLNSD